MYKNIFFLIIAFVFVACKVEEPSIDNEFAEIQTEEEMLKKLEDKGLIPRLDELDRTDSIAGIDLDGNGIRDDIDRWIEKKYPLQIPEAKQMARALQKNLTVNIKNREQLMDSSMQLSKAMRCLIIIKDNELPGFVNTEIIFDELDAITSNTKERLKKDWEVSNALSGNVLPRYKGVDACDE